MNVDPNVLAATRGYLVADARGRLVGRVERTAMPEDGGAGRLWVRGRLPFRRRRVVPLSAVEEIDQTSQVVLLQVDRESLPARG